MIGRSRLSWLNNQIVDNEAAVSISEVWMLVLEGDQISGLTLQVS